MAGGGNSCWRTTLRKNQIAVAPNTVSDSTMPSAKIVADIAAAASRLDGIVSKNRLSHTLNPLQSLLSERKKLLGYLGSCSKHIQSVKLGERSY